MNQHRRTALATLRERTRINRLEASTRRRPRSLTTYCLTTGAPSRDAAGCARSMSGVAKRIGITPAAVATTRRTAAGGRSRRTRTVHRFTREQVAQIAAIYQPRKPEYQEIATRLRFYY